MTKVGIFIYRCIASLFYCRDVPFSDAKTQRSTYVCRAISMELVHMFFRAFSVLPRFEDMNGVCAKKGDSIHALRSICMCLLCNCAGSRER